MAKAALNWQDIKVESLSPELRELYDTMLASKAHFEAGAVNALRSKGLVGTQETALFTYRRGLAFAPVPLRSAKEAVEI
jgi:hypothetical protein